MGAGCDQKCPNGSYGEECTKTCSDHCAGDQNSCHHVNGTCDLGCEPGYQGSSCTQVCPRGRYGSGCTQACSVQCAGRESPCDHVDGSCYFGCKQDDNSFICRSAALTGDESDDSGVKTWAVVATIVAGVALIVAAVAIGILVRRTHKVYTDGSSTSAERGNNSENETCAAFHRDEDRQKPVQQRMDENEGSDHYNESMESGRGDVHRYDTDFDHYDRPENLMKESGVYENQLSG
ncbi:hypothetical protein RRG08_055834 [Elysia crispata]|uniref:Uncharacterized protein n=1 Tax=Elysia crispata TaxID=231223 RepID=A0AAE1E5Z9_9GAST|nr:hypothetical protein RRG08_055834 [Elysia crispata]